MINMTDREYVAGLKSNMHAVFDTPQGKEVLRFLEISCRWYQTVFSQAGPEMTMINDGKRQVIATIKTILDLSPDQIVSIAEKETNAV